MLRSCQYCGRIHEAGYDCPDKIARLGELRRLKNERCRRKRAGEYEYRFRNSVQWQETSKRIRERDNYLCLCCMAELKGTDNKIHDDSKQDLQVHHIVPISENRELRLNENNLITVCSTHHAMCEDGRITRQQQSDLVQKSIDNALEGRIDVL